MNDQFIQGVIFDWDKIDKDSYLKEIRAFKGVEKLDFNKPIQVYEIIECMDSNSHILCHNPYTVC